MFIIRNKMYQFVFNFSINKTSKNQHLFNFSSVLEKKRNTSKVSQLGLYTYLQHSGTVVNTVAPSEACLLFIYLKFGMFML